MSSVTDSLYKL